MLCDLSSTMFAVANYYLLFISVPAMKSNTKPLHKFTKDRLESTVLPINCSPFFVLLTLFMSRILCYYFVVIIIVE